jgi:uncharacterized protein (DUF1330 family)
VQTFFLLFGFSPAESIIAIIPVKLRRKPMTAYVIVDIEVIDAAGYEEYKKLAPPTLAVYGGKYIARGGGTEVLEGDWAPNRLVILQFESVERAKAWLNSPEYSGARSLRHKYARSKMVVVEGL